MISNPAAGLPSGPSDPIDDDEESNADDAPEYQLEGAELEQLLGEIPALMTIKRFASVVDRIHWFSTIGERIDDEVKDVSRRYLDGLGFPDADLAAISSWEEAGDAAASLDFDSEAWEAEEQLRAGLVSEALLHLDEQGLQVTLAHVTSTTSDGLEDAMENMAAIWDLNDETLITAATGAVIQTVYNAALVLAAGGEEDHPFALKFRLFELGRWPIGVHGRSFNLF
jgi:hypothetical protein